MYLFIQLCSLNPYIGVFFKTQSMMLMLLFQEDLQVLRAPWFFRLVVSPLLPFGVNWFGQKKCWMIFSLCRLMADYKPSLSCKPFLCPPVLVAFFFPHLLRLANLRFATVFAKARDNIFPIPPSIPSPRTSEAGPRKRAHASLSQPLKRSRPFSIEVKRAWYREYSSFYIAYSSTQFGNSVRLFLFVLMISTF